jgi:polysaccharide biosynthesis transport protein
VTAEGLLSIWLELARRQIWIILSCALFALCLSAFYIFIRQPTFTASATILIDPRKGGVQQNSVLGDTPSDTAWIDSQVGVLALKKIKIAQAVAKQLQLGDDQNFLDNSGVTDTGLFGAILNFVTEESVAPAATAQLREQQAAGKIASNLDVKRVGLTYLVSISFSSHSPQETVKIANAAADAYIQAELQQKYETLRQASDWLLQRYKALGEEAAAADRAVVEFKRQHSIVTADGKLINDQQLLDVNKRIGEARAKVADDQARLGQIMAVLSEQTNTGNIDATVSDALQDPILTQLRTQYLDYTNKIVDWSKRYGSDHQAVIYLRERVQDIRNSTQKELGRIAESYKSDLEIALKNEAEFEKQLQTIISNIPNAAQIQLGELESRAHSYHTFYDNFLTTYTASVEQLTSPIAETNVVSYANSGAPSNPSAIRIMVLSLMGGLGLGIGLGMLREMADHSFRSSEQVESRLKIRCLAVIPITGKNRMLSAGRALAQEQDRFSQSAIKTLELIRNSPFSRFSESIRAIKLAADLSDSDTSSKVIGITSSLPREGKSTLAASLAAFAGHGGASVVLVDCDLRKSTLSRALFPRRPGIAEVLSGKMSLESAIVANPGSVLSFLPAGNVSQSSEVTQLLGSAELRALFDTLRAKYEYVVVDLPPTAPVIDVRATTKLLDFYIFVVEWGQTNVHVVEHALKDASGVYENALGVVLNKVDMRSIARYEGQRGQYFHNKYFTDYVHSD